MLAPDAPGEPTVEAGQATCPACPRYVFVASLLLALLLRGPSLLDGIKIDEDATLALHHQHDLQGMYFSWRDHPFANYLAYFSARAFPLTENGLIEARFPSFVLGSLTVAIVSWRTFVTTRSLKATLLVTLLFASSDEHCGFSTSVRGYAIQAFGVLLMHLLFLSYIRQPAAWKLLAYTLVGVAALWSHLWTVFVIAAHFLIMLCDRERTPKEKLALFVAQAASGVAIVALLWTVIPDILQGNHNDPRTSYRIASEFNWGFWYNLRSFRKDTAPLVVLFFTTTLVSWWTARWPKDAWQTLAVLALIPAFLFVHPPGAFGTRYVLFCVPLFYLFWGLALGALPEIPARFQRPAWLTLLGLELAFTLTAQLGLPGDLVLGLQKLILFACLAIYFTAWDASLLRDKSMLYVIGVAGAMTAITLL